MINILEIEVSGLADEPGVQGRGRWGNWKLPLPSPSPTCSSATPSLCAVNLRWSMPCTWKSPCPHPNISLRPSSSSTPPKSLPRPPREDRHPLAPGIPLLLHCSNYLGTETKGQTQATLLQYPQGQTQGLAHSSGTTPNVKVRCRLEFPRG